MITFSKMYCLVFERLIKQLVLHRCKMAVFRKRLLAQRMNRELDLIPLHVSSDTATATLEFMFLRCNLHESLLVYEK